MGSGTAPPFGPPLLGPTGRFDNFGQVQTQFQAAQNARQTLALLIYQRLVAVTGAPQPANAAAPAPDDPNLIARRWLAQLAVNIVDYIDEDDISTPLNFYPLRTETQARVDLGTLNTNAQGKPDQELPAFWVFGTEQPHVVLSEVLAEHADATVFAGAGAPNPEKLKVWVELYNTLGGANPLPLQQLDSAPIPFRMPQQARSTNPNATGAAYSAYKLVVSNGLEPRPLNDNLLGKPATYLTRPANGVPLPLTEDFTSPWDFSPNPPKTQPPQQPPTIAPGQYFLLGPSTPGDPAKYRDPFPPGGTVPGGTPVLRSPSLDYVPMFPHQASVPPDERQTGVTVLLRRLANPHLPFDPNPASNKFFVNPFYNPYVTVDYVTNVAVLDRTRPYQSRGKRQPYAALVQLNGGNVYTVNADSPVAPQAAPPVNGVSHTFGRPNNPVPQSGHYDWMVHPDRQVISPMELLHVSGYQPYQLTQQFVTGSNADPTRVFQHYVPWMDQSRRLYRLFEYLESGGRSLLPVFLFRAPSRIPGKVNINTVWDEEIFQAVCDVNGSNWVQDPAVVRTLFNNLRASRDDPGGPAAGPGNPFLGMGAGFTAPGDTQYPKGLGIQSTLLRSGPGGKLLLQNPADTAGVHPYLQYELLTKIYNNLTVRSNVFAVWVTVGFFEVNDASTNPPRLGPEVGRAEGRHVRHRMFAIVDRTGGGFLFGPPGAGAVFDPAQDAGLVPHYSIID
jgi:hypothetical protein